MDWLTLRRDLEAIMESCIAADLKASSRRVYCSRIKQVWDFYAECTASNASWAPRCLPELLNAFITKRMNQGRLSAKSSRDCMSTFRKFARLSGLSFDDSYFDYMPRTVRRAVRAQLSDSEIERLLVVARRESSTRNLALVLLFLTSGVKIGRCTELKLSDLIWCDGGLKLRVQDGFEERLELLSSEVVNVLQSWILLKQANSYGRDSEYLFFGHRGQKITTTAIDAAIRKIGWRSGLQVSSMVLRRSYLRRLAEMCGR